MPNDIAFIPDEWDPLPRIATSDEALPVSANFVNSIRRIRQGDLPGDLLHRSLYRRANADFEVDFELLLCGVRTLRYIPSGMELLANYQWFHPLDSRDRSRPFWSAMNPAERRAYVSSQVPRDFLHLWGDVDYDLPPWQQDPSEQSRHLQLRHDPDAADTITSDSSSDPSPTQAPSIIAQPPLVPIQPLVNLTSRNDPPEASAWYPTRFIHFWNRHRLHRFRGPLFSLAFRIWSLLRFRQPPLPNESSPWESVDPTYGPMPDLIDEPSDPPPAISDASTERVNPNYITSLSSAYQHARVYIDFEGRSIVTILVRLGTHWYTLEHLCRHRDYSSVTRSTFFGADEVEYSYHELITAISYGTQIRNIVLRNNN